MFLCINEAQKEFDNTDYFNRMSNIEIKYRINILGIPIHESIGIDIRNIYKSNILNFSNTEKNTITYFHNISYKLFFKYPKLLPKNIKYIKLKSGFEWNFPFTINNCIVFTETYISNLTNILIKFNKNNTFINKWNIISPNYNDINEYVTVFCHEFIHISQRMGLCKKNIENIYEIWGFSKNKQQKHFNHNLFITNPDGFNEWNIIIDNILYYPMIIIYNNHLKGVLVNEKGYIYDYNNSKYEKLFYGLKSQLYHPNEIFAILVSELIVNGKIYNETEWNSFKFYKSLNIFI